MELNRWLAACFSLALSKGTQCITEDFCELNEEILEKNDFDTNLKMITLRKSE